MHRKSANPFRVTEQHVLRILLSLCLVFAFNACDRKEDAAAAVTLAWDPTISFKIPSTFRVTKNDSNGLHAKSKDGGRTLTVAPAPADGALSNSIRARGKNVRQHGKEFYILMSSNDFMAVANGADVSIGGMGTWQEDDIKSILEGIDAVRD